MDFIAVLSASETSCNKYFFFFFFLACSIFQSMPLSADNLLRRASARCPLCMLTCFSQSWVIYLEYLACQHWKGCRHCHPWGRKGRRRRMEVCSFLGGTDHLGRGGRYQHGPALPVWRIHLLSHTSALLSSALASCFPPARL